MPTPETGPTLDSALDAIRHATDALTGLDWATELKGGDPATTKALLLATYGLGKALEALEDAVDTVLDPEAPDPQTLPAI